MSKKTRINNRDDITKLYRSRNRFSCFQFQISGVKNDYDHVRYCTSVSKRVSKKAVVRSKVKRQVRSFFSTYFNDPKKVQPPIDFYLWIKKGFLEKTYSDNYFAFKQALKILIRNLFLDYRVSKK